MNNWFCYTVTSDTDQVYSGATNNIARRLRQVTRIPTRLTHFTSSNLAQQHHSKSRHIHQTLQISKACHHDGPDATNNSTFHRAPYETLCLSWWRLEWTDQGVDQVALRVSTQNGVSFVDTVGPAADTSAAHNVSRTVPTHYCR
jgi:predicted GIY-YIG superfamily endonuclease